MAAPVYRDYGFLPTKDSFVKLDEAVKALEPYTPPELMGKLREAIEEARAESATRKQIARGGTMVGYVVDKASKAIACDAIIAIVKQIKSAKAW